MFGASLIAGGVFVCDPGYGFPPGTAPGRPDTASWQAAVHAGAAAVGFTALVVAMFVLARRFLSTGERAWAVYSILTGVGVELLSGWTNATVDEGIFLPLWVAIAAGFGWASLPSAKLAKAPASRS